MLKMKKERKKNIRDMGDTVRRSKYILNRYQEEIIEKFYTTNI